MLLRTYWRTHWELRELIKNLTGTTKIQHPHQKENKTGSMRHFIFRNAHVFFFSRDTQRALTGYEAKKIKKEIRVLSRCLVKDSAVGFTKIRVAVGSNCNRPIFWDWVEGKIAIPKALWYTVK
jgi:hypothetical protein